MWEQHTLMVLSSDKIAFSKDFPVQIESCLKDRGGNIENLDKVQVCFLLKAHI